MVGIVHLGTRAADAFEFHLIFSRAQTGGIHDMQGHTINRDFLAQHVTRRSFDISDYGGIDSLRIPDHSDHRFWFKVISRSGSN
jgi:hypothetical protein